MTLELATTNQKTSAAVSAVSHHNKNKFTGKGWHLKATVSH